MRFKNSAVLAAILVALCLKAPFTAHADTALIEASMPNLTIDALHDQGNRVFDIRNDGTVASGFCWMKLSFSNGQVWQMPLFPLVPGSVFHVVIPPVTSLDPFTITLVVDTYNSVRESNEADNVASLRYHEGPFPWRTQPALAGQ